MGDQRNLLALKNGNLESPYRLDWHEANSGIAGKRNVAERWLGALGWREFLCQLPPSIAGNEKSILVHSRSFLGG
jgi:deoxyribodipyrimidine photolyase